MTLTHTERLVNGEILAGMAGQNDYYVQANTTGLSDAEGMTEVPNGGNSVNWILGHMVYWRNEILALIGGERLWAQDEGLAYRGHPGERRPKDFDPSRAFALQRLIGDFARAGERLSTRLNGEPLEADALAGAASLLTHEAYHAGQLGVLRRVAGLDGAV